MRVLQIIDSLNMGGAERVAVNYANLLVGKVEKSFLCVTRQEGPFKANINDQVDYVFLNKCKVVDIKAFFKLHKYIKHNKIEIIHAHSSSFFIATVIKLFNRRLKLIWHDHYGNSEFLDHRKSFILKFCSLKFSSIISVNYRLKEWALNSLQCKKAISLNNFVINDEKQIKQTFLRGEEGKRIICLANLKSQKDHLTLILAFNKVLQYHKDWTLHIIGEDYRDRHSRKIHDKVNELGISESVYFYGAKKDISHILSQADIGVLSSESEGLPLTLLEYGISRLAVVSTNVGDCDKVIKNSSEGILVAPKDYNAFSNALLSYIKSESLRKEASIALSKSICESFDPNEIMENVIEIYKD